MGLGYENLINRTAAPGELAQAELSYEETTRFIAETDELLTAIGDDVRTANDYENHFLIDASSEDGEEGYGCRSTWKTSVAMYDKRLGSVNYRLTYREMRWLPNYSGGGDRNEIEQACLEAPVTIRSIVIEQDEGGAVGDRTAKPFEITTFTGSPFYEYELNMGELSTGSPDKGGELTAEQAELATEKLGKFRYTLRRDLEQDA